ncbi:protein-disulfide reductase DsbD domain-containing protein, partial [Flavobacterium sp.]|uniref:cytochrome c biogenesis protein CcdA n=1 Tax=Flavobacterium sp. TaxID=239 RepID=UPI0037BFFE40
MKKVLFFLLIFLAFANANAQIVKPVKWTSKVEKINDSEFNLIMEATIEKDWHVYSQFTPENGPLPAEFTFENAKGNFELLGKTKESPYKKQYNDVFEVDEYYFEKKATFTQKIKITNPKLTSIKAKIDCQVCKDVCIGEFNTFTFQLPKIEITGLDQPVSSTDTAVVDTTQIAPVAVKPTTVTETTAPKKAENRGLWTIFFLAFLGGFAALLTPCVFPMIPMTVSFFTKQSKNPAQGKRNAILYGISIIAIYVVLGLAITGIFGADALNALSTNAWFNVFFFLLLVIFAVSFLGA